MRVVLDTNIFVSMLLGGQVGVDNKFLNVAVAAGVDCIVSGDGHLLDLNSFCGIPILSARRFIDRFLS